MNGYYGRPDLTEKAFRVDETGKWYITGDYATMDTDGCLTVLDRYLDPIVITSKGKKEEVQLLDVVEKIKTDRNIKLCKLTFNGGKLILHLSIDTFTGLDPEDAKNSIIETIKAQLDEKYWPDIIQIYDELPKTAVGKIDPEALEEEGEKLVQDCVSEEKLHIVDKTKDMMKLSRKK
jgi:acyl-CoA synthetase (AMP-forming)/AMP-acid ligase II